MRNLRWATELAVSNDSAKAGLGIAQLRALGESDLLNPANNASSTPRSRLARRPPG